MKKRALAFLLAVTMIVGMAIPIQAATLSGDYKFAVEGTDNGGTGLKVTIKMMAKSISSNVKQYIILSVDASKFTLVGPDGTTPLTLQGFNGTEAVDMVNWGANSTAEHAQISQMLFGKMSSDNSRIYVMMSVSSKMNFDNVGPFVGTFTPAAAFYLKYNTGMDETKLDSTSIVMADPQVALDEGQTACASIQETSGVIYHYGHIDRTDPSDPKIDISKDTMERPQITYPNSNVYNLGKVEVKMDYTDVNSPKLLPTKENARTVDVDEVKAFDDLGNEFPSDEADNVVYTYSLTATPEGGTKATVAPGDPYFAIDAITGVVTIQPGAPIAALEVTATGSYRGSSVPGNTTLNVHHGDAGDVVPGGDPSGDETPKFSGVVITKSGAIVATSAGVTHTEKIGIPGTGAASNQVTFVGNAVDQFGGAFTTGLPSDGWDASSVSPSTGTTITSGVVTVTDAATAGNYTYKYEATDGVDTYDATVTIKVSGFTITWPSLLNSTITYGEPISSLTIDSDGTVERQGTDLTANYTFAWDVPDTSATLNAGTPALTMKCFETAAPTNVVDTESYTVTVNKANQTIELKDITGGGNTVITAASVDVGDGTPVTLTATAYNATVSTLASGKAITYTLAGGNGGDALMDDTTTPGNAVITAGSNVGKYQTLTIKAAGDSNYNEKTETIDIYSQNAFLHATISFAPAAPKFGDTITATITEASDQPSSLTSDVKYIWGYIDTGDNNKFVALTATAANGRQDVSGNLTAATVVAPATTGSTTVQYTTVEEDVGKILALQVVTPVGVASYGYAHSVEDQMTNAVAKAKWSKPTVTVKTKDTYSVELNPVTVTSTEVAEYAIKESSQLTTLEYAVPSDLVWGSSVTFNNLKPDTKYTVFVKIDSDAAHEESDIQQFDVTTDKIVLTNPPTDPKVTNFTAATVTLGTEKAFAETVTATITDAQVTYDGVAETNPIFVKVTWTRDDNTELKTETLNGTTWTSTYKYVEADIGHTVTVTVTPAATSKYTGSVDTTSATVVKAAATLTTAGFGTEKASKAGVADGKITIEAPADASVAYEIRLKAESGQPENAWGDATIVPAVVAPDPNPAPAYIGSLTAGTYELRLKATNTHEASNAIELTVGTLGYNITGRVESYNSARAVTYHLYKLKTGDPSLDGTALTHYDMTAAAYTGTAIAVETGATSGVKTQNFTIPAIANGTYVLILSKDVHVRYTILKIVVNDADIDLKTCSVAEIALISMGAGDVNGDGTIGFDDDNEVFNTANFGNDPTAVGVNEKADVDGDGAIGFDDDNVIFNTKYFGKQESDYRFVWRA